MKDLNNELETAPIVEIDPRTFEIEFKDGSFTVVVGDGFWRINPYEKREFEQMNVPLIHVR